MRLSIALVLIATAFVAGMETLRHAYDPKNLEENSLVMIELSFTSGCQKGSAYGRKPANRFEKCRTDAKAYRKMVEEIFHHEIWEKNRE